MTCQKWWTIGRSGERGSGISVLAAQHDDDDDDNVYALLNGFMHGYLLLTLFNIIFVCTQLNCFKYSYLDWVILLINYSYLIRQLAQSYMVSNNYDYFDYYNYFDDYNWYYYSDYYNYYYYYRLLQLLLLRLLQLIMVIMIIVIPHQRLKRKQFGCLSWWND